MKNELNAETLELLALQEELNKIEAKKSELLQKINKIQGQTAESPLQIDNPTSNSLPANSVNSETSSPTTPKIPEIDLNLSLPELLTLKEQLNRTLKRVESNTRTLGYVQNDNLFNRARYKAQESELLQKRQAVDERIQSLTEQSTKGVIKINNTISNPLLATSINSQAAPSAKPKTPEADSNPSWFQSLFSKN